MREDRFWRKVSMGGVNDCWEWLAFKLKTGYGRFRMGSEMVYAHRVAYCLHHGLELVEIRSKCVCHSCDNPPCCNPDHLWIGTKADNQHDMAEKGRSQVGEKHHNTKMKDYDIKNIRDLLKSGWCTQQTMANAFGVSQSTISKIHTGQSWKHII